MDREAWWDTVHGVAKSWTQLNWFSTQHPRTLLYLKINGYEIGKEKSIILNLSRIVLWGMSSFYLNCTTTAHRRIAAFALLILRWPKGAFQLTWQQSVWTRKIKVPSCKQQMHPTNCSKTRSLTPWEHLQHNNFYLPYNCLVLPTTVRHSTDSVLRTASLTFSVCWKEDLVTVLMLCIWNLPTSNCYWHSASEMHPEAQIPGRDQCNLCPSELHPQYLLESLKWCSFLTTETS